MAPVAVSRVRPVGNAGVTAHAYGGVPPDPVSVAEYGSIEVRPNWAQA